MESCEASSDAQGIERSNKNDLAEKITQLQSKLAMKSIRKGRVLMVCACFLVSGQNFSSGEREILALLQQTTPISDTLLRFRGH